MHPVSRPNLLLLSAAIVFVAGCGGPNAPTASELPRLETVPTRGGGFTYVGFQSGPSVFEYPEQNRGNDGPLCILNGDFIGVEDIAVDRAGNLWVPAFRPGGGGLIKEFGPNCGKLKRVLIDPKAQPFDVGFDSKGNVYVADLSSSIKVYAPGAVRPTRLLTDKIFLFGVIGLAVDANDNLHRIGAISAASPSFRAERCRTFFSATFMPRTRATCCSTAPETSCSSIVR
jgi:hypothetical protein